MPVYKQKQHSKTLISNYNARSSLINCLHLIAIGAQNTQTLISKLWSLSQKLNHHTKLTLQSIVRHIKTKTKIKLERDKDRKQFTREYLNNCDTEKYEEQQRKDQERKRLAKEGREIETVETPSIDQNQESTSTPSLAFKHKQSLVL